jgi:hypothetical protein
MFTFKGDVGIRRIRTTTIPSVDNIPAYFIKASDTTAIQAGIIKERAVVFN